MPAIVVASPRPAGGGRSHDSSIVIPNPSTNSAVKTALARIGRWSRAGLTGQAMNAVTRRARTAPTPKYVIRTMPDTSRYQRECDPSSTAETAERAATPLRPKLLAAWVRLALSERSQKLAAAATTSPKDTSQKNRRSASPPASSAAPDLCSRSNDSIRSGSQRVRSRVSSNLRSPAARTAWARARALWDRFTLLVATKAQGLLLP